MDVEIAVAIIGMISMLSTTLLAGIFNKEVKRRKVSEEEIEARRKESEEKAEARAKIRAEESRLSMNFMAADIKFSKAIAIAVRDQKINGEMTEAFEKAKRAEDEYYNFINGVAAEQIVME